MIMWNFLIYQPYYEPVTSYCIQMRKPKLYISGCRTPSVTVLYKWQKRCQKKNMINDKFLLTSGKQISC